jgi:cysteinyl-tRNA synthetase
MDAAATALDRMRNGFFALPSDAATPPDAPYVERFTNEINDDLNVPRALAVAWEVLRGDLPPAVKRATLARQDEVFGLGLVHWQPKDDVPPPAVAAIAMERAAARTAKRWADADRLRADLAALGWDMEDQPAGYRLRRRG